MKRRVNPNFIYLSQVFNAPLVLSGSGRRLGCIYDVVADIRGQYPRINALIVKKRFRKKLTYYPWSSIKEVNEGKNILIDSVDEAADFPLELGENELCLRETFWDKQIVDIAGSKVVRVNDLHLLKDGIKLWLVHVDVGLKGLLRRLGWLRSYSAVIRWLFDYEMKDKFIPWKYVQPISPVDVDTRKSLSLTVPHAKLAELHPADLADILADLGTEERILIFNSFDVETAAEILQEFPLKLRILTAESIEMEKLAQIVLKMPMDETVDLLDDLPQDTRKSLFDLLPPDEVKQITELLKHPERSAGGLMNNEFITARESDTVGKVLKKIKSVGSEIESIYYIYVVNDADIPVGVTTLKQLLLSGSRQTVGSIMRENVVRIPVDTHIKKVARVFFKYNFMVVPVVDSTDRIIGIITIKDALEAVFPEMSEETD